ncbi:hypothetical protein BC936DRAFT_141167, partial [Jimgerdemannia flammicorona]
KKKKTTPPSGAGKSTVSDRLSALLPASPHVELDALHWNEDWLPTGDAEFRDRVRVMLGSLHGWVVDGNYRVVRGVIWPQADTFVWLDLPRLVTIPRVLRRTLGRVVSGRELWGKRGTVERWNNVLFSSDSIIYWAWIGKTKQRSQFPVELAKPEYTGLKVVRLRDPVEVEVFLELIAEGGQRTNVEFSSLD